MRRLREAGLEAGLALAPVLPAITDDVAVIDDVFARAAAAGVRRSFWQVLFLRSPTRETFMSWLARELPAQLAPYQALYAGGGRLRGEYPRRLAARIERLRARHGLGEELFEAAVPGPMQLALVDRARALYSNHR